MPPRAGAIRAGRAFVELFADDTRLVRGLKRAQARIRAFGQKASAMGRQMAMLGTVAIAPLIASAKTFASLGDQIAKMSKRTGVGVEALSALRYAASQSGTSIGALEKGLRRMQRTVYDAERGLSTAVDGLSDMGLTVQDLQGLSPEAQFRLIADRIAAIEDPTRKAALAMVVFGRSGTNLLPMLNQGAAGLDAFRRKAEALGIIISKEDAVAAEKFSDQLDTLGKTVKMAAFRVGAALAPTLGKLAGKLVEAARAAQGWVKRNQDLIVTILKVTAGVIAAGVVLVVIGKVAAGVSALITVVKALTVAVTFLAAHPLVLAAAALVAVAAAFYKVSRAATQTSNSMRDLRQANDRARAADLDRMERLKELSEKERLNVEQMKEAKGLIAALEIRYGKVGVKVNEMTGSIEGLNTAQAEWNALLRERRMIDLRKEFAEAQKMQRKLAKALRGEGSLSAEFAAGLRSLGIGDSEEDIQRALQEQHNIMRLAGKEMRILESGATGRRALTGGAKPAGSAGAAGTPPAAGAGEASPEAARNRAALESRMAADAARRQRIEELELRNRYEGLELQKKMLDLEEERAKRAAWVAGEDIDAVRKEYALRKKLLELKAGVDTSTEERRAATARGTFYARAVGGLGGQDLARRTADATEKTARGVSTLVRRPVLTFSGG